MRTCHKHFGPPLICLFCPLSKVSAEAPVPTQSIVIVISLVPSLPSLSLGSATVEGSFLVTLPMFTLSRGGGGERGDWLLVNYNLLFVERAREIERDIERER